MPCYDPRDDDEDRKNANGRLLRLEAMLCQLGNIIHKKGISVQANWNSYEAGVSFNEYAAWRNKHDYEDSQKRKKKW